MGTEGYRDASGRSLEARLDDLDRKLDDLYKLNTANASNLTSLAVKLFDRLMQFLTGKERPYARTEVLKYGERLRDACISGTRPCLMCSGALPRSKKHCVVCRGTGLEFPRPSDLLDKMDSE